MLFRSALSMGAGAYLASKSEREVYESEIARERAEIEEDPHEEQLELELFYQLKGFSPEEARTMAERLRAEPKQFLRALARSGWGREERRRPRLHHMPCRWTGRGWAARRHFTGRGTEEVSSIRRAASSIGIPSRAS